jgi:hypothetical protein
MLSCLGVLPAKASIAYNNDFGGVVSGDNFGEDAWVTGSGISVTDSFSLTSDATVSGFNVAVWIIPGDTFGSLDWSITTAAFGGTTLASSTGATSTAETFLAANTRGYDVYEETFSIPSWLPLTADTTYWLQIGNSAASNGDTAAWDQSDGPSTAFQSNIGELPDGQMCNGLCTGSESFEILSAPEPGTLLLLGAGLIALAGLRRRS